MSRISRAKIKQLLVELSKEMCKSCHGETTVCLAECKKQQLLNEIVEEVGG